jgi:hypothetical protein
MNDILPFAKRMLAEHEEFHPYGGFLRTDGSIVHVGAEARSVDYPSGKDLIDSLQRDFRRRAKNGEIKAAAIVSNVRVTPPSKHERSDAIQATVEHRDSYCADVFFPYRIDEKGIVEFASVFAQACDPIVFR